MPKVTTEARSICPELIDAIKVIDRLARVLSYHQVFSDLIDWLVWEHLFPPQTEDSHPLKKYNDQEIAQFKEIYNALVRENTKRINLHCSDPNTRTPAGWYDGLGRIYECIVSRNKSSAMGQYFTPAPVVNLMTEMMVHKTEGELARILDPACGSGRMGLSGFTKALLAGIPTWITMNDLDPLCTKMAAINMCFHGAVGEVLCMNGLDVQGDSYRFGYQVVTLMTLIPPERWELIQMIGFLKTKQNILKQYILLPISYEQTYLKQVNDQLLREFEQRKQIADEQQRKQALADLQETINARLAGTLFDGDTSQAENVELPKKTPKRTKKKPKKPKSSSDDQTTLF